MSRRRAALVAGVAAVGALAAALPARAGEFAGPLTDEAAWTADDLDSQIRRIEIRMIPGGWTPLAPSARIDIAAGAAGEYSWAFTAGQYVAAAGTCGHVCVEVRLNLFDPAGVLLARAYQVADGWALEAEIQDTGEHRLVMSAEDCAADPCRVGLLSYMRWPD